MYTEPKIVTKNNLAYRSYISFTFNGKRFREYNGNRLKLKIYPNYATTLKEKDRLLRSLLFEFKKALQIGWNPTAVLVESKPEIVVPPPTIEKIFLDTQREKMTSPLSDKYKRNIRHIVKQFLAFLSDDEKQQPVSTLTPIRVEQFLSTFKSSSLHYMNMRRMLGVFFSEFVRKKIIDVNPVMLTAKLKPKAALHKIYTKEQLTNLLNFLKVNNRDLYMCCILSYSCMLRPHQEIRLLKRKHFNDDFTTISLSGAENKSARVRVVSVPSYLKEIIKERFKDTDNTEFNLFSLNTECYNESYFNTIWTRLKPAMLINGVLQKDQTIYSFRHTAAVDVYNRTKDLHILQQLLGHSTMLVTLKYLRGLGELNNQQIRDVLPVLEMV